jgi:hypothetical protein
MSYIKNNINFTPFHPRQTNQVENNFNFSQSQSNFNNKINSFSNNNYNFNASKIVSNYQDIPSYNNISNNNYYSNDYNYTNDYEELNEFNSCYILINGLDEYSKDTFLNFLDNQGINTRDVKVLDKNKIIVKFGDQKSRNEFMNEFNKIKGDFFGIEIRYINEEENNRIINNNANKISHRTSYYNNYMNDSNNMIQLPRKKSNFQKFLEVFLNL